MDLGIILALPNTYSKRQDISNLVEDDARLSDFTINSLYLPLGYKLSEDNIIDPLAGISDIKNQVIRMVEPNTFVRNPECMLRAVRMSDKLSAQIDSETADSIRKYSHLIKRAPRPVVEQNLKEILSSENKMNNISMLQSLKLLEHLRDYIPA